MQSFSCKHHIICRELLEGRAKLAHMNANRTVRELIYHPALQFVSSKRYAINSRTLISSLVANVLIAGAPAWAADAAAQLLELERNLGSAICRGDTAFYDRVTADDFVMTHSDRWTTGASRSWWMTRLAFASASRTAVACTWISIR
jgi:hypothetical protein